MNIRTENHANRAYQHLRDRLLAGDFEPGARLLYGPIGKEIGVSATPVREAAGRLANEGLVELIPNLGAVVSRIDRAGLIEVYEVREIIEPRAASLASQRANPDSVTAMGEAMETMRTLTHQHAETGEAFAIKSVAREFDFADYSFHSLILEATGNEFLVRTASQSHVLTRVFGIRPHRYTTESMRRTVQEHERIYLAIESGEANAAMEASAAHIRSGLESSLKELDVDDE